VRVAGGSASGAGDGGDATAGGAAGAGTGLPADGVAALGSLAAASEGFAASLQPQGTRRPSHASNNVAAASPLARSVAVRLSPVKRLPSPKPVVRKRSQRPSSVNSTPSSPGQTGLSEHTHSAQPQPHR